MGKIWTIALMLFVGQVSASAQSLASLMNSLATAPMDNMKYDYSDEMVEFIQKMEFGSFKRDIQYLRHVRCEQVEAELFSWSFPLEDRSLQFYNVIKVMDIDTVIVIKGKSGKIETGKYDFLVYDMEGFFFDKDIHFVLLGWNQAPRMNYKIIQMVHIYDDGNYSFDCPILRVEHEGRETLFDRMRFQYKIGMSMTLKLDHESRTVMFDHMSSAGTASGGEDNPFGPDGSYCGFRYRRSGYWDYVEDVSIKELINE